MKLSASELTCLRWVAEGRAIEDIALFEDRTPEIILMVVASALEKLNTKSLHEAIEKAQALGVI